MKVANSSSIKKKIKKDNNSLSNSTVLHIDVGLS